MNTTRDVLGLALVVLLSAAAPARAQDPPPRIGPFAIDLHATVPQFPSENVQLAESRSMDVAELPGNGLGLQLGLHLYPLRWRAVTFGIGAEVIGTRATQQPLHPMATQQRQHTQIPDKLLEGNEWPFFVF